MATLMLLILNYRSGYRSHQIPPKISIAVAELSIDINQTWIESPQYKQRREFLKTQCYDRGNPMMSISSIEDDDDGFLNHLGFVLRSRSLFYCSVPKVATRTLLNYITYLHIRDELIITLTKNSSVNFRDDSNLFNVDYLNEMLASSIKNDSLLLLSRFLMTLKWNSTQIDLWAMYQKFALPYVRLRTLSDPSVLFGPSFTRVIFVRHPLERLASAYIDKIGTVRAKPLVFYDPLRQAICRKYASFYFRVTQRHVHFIERFFQKETDRQCQKVIPIFEHFVEYIMSHASQTDVHWQPYSTLCSVCRLRYNFIGKYETIQQDLNALRLKFGLNFTHWNGYRQFSSGKTKENYKLMYSKLPNHLLCRLKTFYSEDLRFFDYRFDDYLPDHQQINCTTQRYRRFNAFLY